jgi:hypothetical protein
VLRGDNDSIGRHRHHGIEVVRRQRGGEIAELVGERCVKQRKIRTKRRLQQEVSAVYLDSSLTLLDDGPDPAVAVLSD